MRQLVPAGINSEKKQFKEQKEEAENFNKLLKQKVCVV